MHSSRYFALTSVLFITLALIVGSTGPADSFANTGNLSALPGCAGQCHTNGHFTIDPRTGKKAPIKPVAQWICSQPRNECGPLFCQRMRTCCLEGKCQTQNLGNPTPR